MFSFPSPMNLLHRSCSSRNARLAGTSFTYERLLLTMTSVNIQELDLGTRFRTASSSHSQSGGFNQFMDMRTIDNGL